MALTLDQALTGISGILVTPFDERGDIAPGRLAPILDRALAPWRPGCTCPWSTATPGSSTR